MRMRRVHESMRNAVIKEFSKRIRRCSVDGRKRYEHEKRGRKSFETGLVWTGPKIKVSGHIKGKLKVKQLYMFACLRAYGSHVARYI